MIGAIQVRDDGRRAALALAGAALAAPARPLTLPRRILVVRPDHLGDLLFLTPAIRRLRVGFPDAHIVGLIGPWGLPVLDRNPNLDGLMSWDFPWFDRKARRSALAPYASLFALARRLRGERFDVAVQFRSDFWWGALAAKVAGIPDQVSYAAPIARHLYSTAYPVVHGRHAADENLALASQLTGVVGPEPLGFPVRDSERARAAELFAGLPASRPIVALQVGAGAKVKLWPPDRLAEVGRQLAGEVGVGIVVIGGPTEIEMAQRVADGVGFGVLNLAGRTNLGELAGVLERCALAIGPDSGPLHLAVAVGTPTIHVFGPADARRFGPYGDPFWHRVVRSERPCAPCNQLSFDEGELSEHSCVREIGAERVLAVAREVLERSIARQRLR
jgi:heptosyltransferase-2/heptosyltransferase-3